MMNHREHAQSRHQNEPKPKEDVDFFIYDVYGHNTHGIVILYCSRRSIFAVGTFCNSGKYRGHGINSGFGVGIQKVYGIHTKGTERFWTEMISFLPDLCPLTSNGQVVAKE